MKFIYSMMKSEKEGGWAAGGGDRTRVNPKLKIGARNLSGSTPTAGPAEFHVMMSRIIRDDRFRKSPGKIKIWRELGGY